MLKENVYIVRGIRNARDHEFEKTIRNINLTFRLLILFLIPPSRSGVEVSSLVKGLWNQVAADCYKYVPSQF